MTDLRQENYNKYTYLPNVPYKIISYLLKENELCWRLMKYTDPHAYRLDTTHPNLTALQKGALIYDGVKNQSNCRVFLDYGQDDSWVEEVCILRVSVVGVIPTTHIYGNLSIGFEIYSHYKINTLSNYQTRVSMMVQQLVETFNGADLGEEIGRLYFDNSNYRSKMVLLGAAPFKGAGIIMSNHSL